jgi:hypothetical protein
MYEEANWRWDDLNCNTYIRPLYSGLLNTYMLELSFNDVRDCEARLDKHDQLSTKQRQAVCIRSVHGRLPDSVPTVNLEPADFGDSTSPGVMRAGSFEVTGSSYMSEEDAGIRADTIIDGKKDLKHRTHQSGHAHIIIMGGSTVGHRNLPQTLVEWVQLQISRSGPLRRLQCSPTVSSLWRELWSLHRKRLSCVTS